MDTDIIDLDAFNHEQLRLHSLMDDDPRKQLKKPACCPLTDA